LREIPFLARFRLKSTPVPVGIFFACTVSNFGTGIPLFPNKSWFIVARILVVDDEANQCRSLAICLRLEGFEVIEAVGGEQALKQLQQCQIHLAIVDLMMPRINGIELARRMQCSYPNIAVVLTSAYHLSESQLAHLKLGAIAFIPKPFVLEDLADFLRNKLSVISS
jgi:DNA-binding NtrC family response regulator